MRAPAVAPETSILRAASLIALGSFVLHELRYLLDPAAQSTVWAGDHGYLQALLPLAATAAFSVMAASLFRRRVPFTSRNRRRRLDRPGSYAVALLGVHLAQEAIEAMAAGGFGPELIINLLVVAAFSIPLALGLGGIAALVAAWLDRVEHRLGSALGARLRVGASHEALLAPAVSPLRDLKVASLRLARGPPRLSFESESSANY